MPADDLIATYRVQTDGASIDERAEALLLEQTVELPRTALHDAEAAARAVGHVMSIDRIGVISTAVPTKNTSSAM